jgi:Interferon-induced transmembrane protein
MSESAPPGGFGPPPSHGYGVGPPSPPPNYLVQAILTTLFCCLPFGIVSIVFAAQVNSKFSAGDVAGAVNASSRAKLWAWLSFGFGLAVGLIAVASGWGIES